MRIIFVSFGVALLMLVGFRSVSHAALPGMAIDETGVVSVFEGSVVTDTYSVALASAPTANVVVQVSAPREQLLVSPATLTFTKENWNTPQTVTVEAFDDLIYEQAHTAVVSHIATSTDALYAEKSVAVTVQITDNDAYGSSGGRDYQLPDAPTEIKATSDGKSVTITWKDPTMPDLRYIEVMRNSGGTTPVDASNPGQAQKGDRTYTDTAVTPGQTYLYQLRAKDWSGNARLTNEFSIKVVAPASIVPVTPPVVVLPTPLPAPVPMPEPAPGFGTPELAAQEVFVKSDAQQFGIMLSEDQSKSIAYFYLNGLVRGSIADYSVKLGAGERRALLRDYFDTAGYSNVNWDDMARLASGQKPVGRNLAKEQAQAKVALAMWLKVKGKNPNFKNVSEDLAWNTLMYRIRFTRDLTKEQAGIVKFKAAFKRVPVSPMDWAMVRALGYVL